LPYSRVPGNGRFFTDWEAGSLKGEGEGEGEGVRVCRSVIPLIHPHSRGGRASANAEA